LRHGLPKFRLTDPDISVGLFFLSMRFHRLERAWCRRPQQSFPTAFEAWLDAYGGFRQPAFAGP
jgi:hypothetical protein